MKVAMQRTVQSGCGLHVAARLQRGSEMRNVSDGTIPDLGVRSSVTRSVDGGIVKS